MPTTEHMSIREKLLTSFHATLKEIEQVSPERCLPLFVLILVRVLSLLRSITVPPLLLSRIAVSLSAHDRHLVKLLRPSGSRALLVIGTRSRRSCSGSVTLAYFGFLFAITFHLTSFGCGVASKPYSEEAPRIIGNKRLLLALQLSNLDPLLGTVGPTKM